MGTRELAEAIILQALEDLWDERQRRESVRFLTSREFSAVSRLAGLDGAGIPGDLQGKRPRPRGNVPRIARATLRMKGENHAGIDTDRRGLR